MGLKLRKTVFGVTNNKGADQPAHPRSPINAFVVLSLESIISIVTISKISIFQLVSVAEQVSFGMPKRQVFLHRGL